MDDKVDHYVILGLPSGEEGAKLTDKEITKAYRKKALELHPDKRPDDRNAHASIQQLNASHAILKDEKSRKCFDDLLRIKRDKVRSQSQSDNKRRKMMSDLVEREPGAFVRDHVAKSREEERITCKFKEEVARVRATHANKVASTTQAPRKAAPTGGRESMKGGGCGQDKEKVLKVSWEKVGENYSAQRLRELFEKFGEVEDLIIKGSKKRGSALVAMVSKDAAVAATRSMCGDLSNPLLVLPLQPTVTTTFPSPLKHFELDGLMLNNLFGAGFQLFEASVLKKLQKSQRHPQDLRCSPLYNFAASRISHIQIQQYIGKGEEIKSQFQKAVQRFSISVNFIARLHLPDGALMSCCCSLNTRGHPNM